ncbi:hypothetical protein CR513_46040, partial [Mucuna pruriens]
MENTSPYPHDFHRTPFLHAPKQPDSSGSSKAMRLPWGVIGHPMEKCWDLKHKVQDPIDGGWLEFQEHEPNVNNNPLLVHGSPSINTISHECQGCPTQSTFDYSNTGHAYLSR